MSKVMSDLMALFNHIINTFIIAMEFLQCKENNCALMFIMSNHMEENILQLDMSHVICLM